MNKRQLTLWGALILSGMALAFTGQALLRAITPNDIKGAANISGLEFTQPELDSMVKGLEEYRKYYTENRAQALPYTLSPAFVFNPQPAGFKMPQFATSGGFSSGAVKLPTDKNQLAFFSIQQLAHLISSKQITSVELTKFYIERLKKYDEKLKCVVTLMEEQALKQAAAADAEFAGGNYRGILHGIPYGLKDIFATKTGKTTWGSKPFKEQQFDYDATVAKRLEDAGAILVAKLSTGYLAWGDQWFGGKTRNPWDLNSGSSGSSAGSAAAVAAGLVPFAIGTETYGSIVSPSATCGVTGLRPTFGRVSRYGAMALSWTMDKVGPICRSGEECAIVLQAIVGPDNKDLSVANVPFIYNNANKSNRFKIGFIKSEMEKVYPGSDKDMATMEKLREMGFDLMPLEWPKMPNIEFILEAEAAAAFDELTRTNKDDQLEKQVRMAWPNMFRQARQIPAVEYIQAQRLRAQLIEEVNKLYDQVDVIIHPATQGNGLLITNLTGHPSICVPNGFENNKPSAITFTGKLYDEAKLAAMAQSYQEFTGLTNYHPNMDNPNKPASLPPQPKKQ